jgi:hypothetical protein
MCTYTAQCACKDARGEKNVDSQLKLKAFIVHGYEVDGTYVFVR